MVRADRWQTGAALRQEQVFHLPWLKGYQLRRIDRLQHWHSDRRLGIGRLRQPSHQPGICLCTVQGFHVGITDGNFGAASEVLFMNLTLANNDTRVVMNDFNSLDHLYLNLSIGLNGIGIDSGAASGFQVYEGSASQNSIADFKIQQNADCSINGFRTEDGTCFVLGADGSCSIRNCLEAGDGLSNRMIQGNFNSLSIKDSIFNSWIAPDSVSRLTMEDNFVRADSNTRLPFVYNGSSINAAIPMRVNCVNNRDTSQFPNLPVDDFLGTMKLTEAYVWIAFQRTAVFSDSSQKVSGRPKCQYRITVWWRLLCVEHGAAARRKAQYSVTRLRHRPRRSPMHLRRSVIMFCISPLFPPTSCRLCM